MIHVHLDPLGGLAGDMFAAALMAAFPAQQVRVADAVTRAVAVRCRLLPHNDGVLDGMRFQVDGPDGRAADAPEANHDHDHGHDHDHRHDHGHGHGHGHGHRHEHEHEHGAGHEHEHEHEDRHAHRAWREIRAHLQGCGLEPAVSEHAVGIFAVLAEAEGRVHGVAADAVTFHEVGAADSIADIVAASVLIDGIGATGWSVSALPLGSGRIRTAHGIMPVPAPATALLLDGFEVADDGIAGERVTPTGAAILRYLRNTGRLRARPSGRLGASGVGFGTRVLPGTSNCVRALAIEAPAVEAPAVEGRNAADTPNHRTLGVIAFEVDDQSGEDLAAGLDRIRRTGGVHDVVQMAAIGKKGRMAVHVQVLAAPDALDVVVAACFTETTTIGLRTHLVQGQALPRRIARTVVDGAPVDVKLAQRPDGATAKAEADHLLDLSGQARRQGLRRQAEALALALALDWEDGT